MANHNNNIPIPPMRPRPHRKFPCTHCLEHWVIEKLVGRLYEESAIDEWDAISFSFRICRQLIDKHNTSVTPHRIMKKIVELRRRYLAFRRFLTLKGVSYTPEINLVKVDLDYVQNIMPQETPSEANFRLDGLPSYEDLHYIFKNKKFPKFELENPAACEAIEALADSSDDPME